MTETELHLLTGDLMYALNHEQTGRDSRTVLELLEHLEKAQLTYDGDLDILWCRTCVVTKVFFDFRRI
jgi:hypothetical protein